MACVDRGRGVFSTAIKVLIYFLLEFEHFWIKAKINFIHMTFTVLLYVSFELLLNLFILNVFSPLEWRYSSAHISSLKEEKNSQTCGRGWY